MSRNEPDARLQIFESSNRNSREPISQVSLLWWTVGGEQ